MPATSFVPLLSDAGDDRGRKAIRRTLKQADKTKRSQLEGPKVQKAPRVEGGHSVPAAAVIDDRARGSQFVMVFESSVSDSQPTGMRNAMHVGESGRYPAPLVVYCVAGLVRSDADMIKDVKGGKYKKEQKKKTVREVEEPSPSQGGKKARTEFTYNRKALNPKGLMKGRRELPQQRGGIHAPLRGRERNECLSGKGGWEYTSDDVHGKRCNPTTAWSTNSSQENGERGEESRKKW
ncbi:hypothetical protein BC827DRAFT_1154310 [Russula dissimulans]|nr:hypothetical protein BC827DRAFT_1154310 [Russula dissimulans]